MSAKAYDKPTAAFFGFLGQNVPAELTSEEMQDWLEHPDEMKVFLRGLKRDWAVQAPRLNRLGVTHFPAIVVAETRACLVDTKTWLYVDQVNMHTFLPSDQHATDGCSITSLQPATAWSYASVVRSVLKSKEVDVVKLGQQLVDGGHTLTLRLLEELVRKTDRGQATGLSRSRGGARNHCFLPTGEAERPVVLATVFHLHDSGRHGWRIHFADQAPHDGMRNPGDAVLLVRNIPEELSA
jgi:hypothetical protein